MDIFDALSKAVSGLGSQLWTVANACALVGLISMALVQLWKDLFGPRQQFQKSRLRSWLNAREDQVKDKHQQSATAGKVEGDLIRLATSGDAEAFYDLPIEQLCGQMNAALQAALDYPELHREMVWCFAYQCDTADVVALFKPPKDHMEKKREELRPEQKELVDNYVAARNRVGHQFQRAVDGIQISIGFAWKWRLQLISLLLSIFIALLAIFLAKRESQWAYGIPQSLVIGILAGFLAPVSRDLVAGLQQFRKA
jgi:hypothetical protein